MTQEERNFLFQSLSLLGQTIAKQKQEKAPEMEALELYRENKFFPDFYSAVANENMLSRKAGFVCKSPAGRIVRLVQPYDSTIYTAAPEELPAQWGFVWPTYPEYAQPFVSLATSPYNKGDWCLNAESVPVCSNIDNNVWSPDTNPEYWDTEEAL